jgi:hypothetical protein
MRARVPVVETEPPLVFVAQPAEELGKRELDALGLELVPGRRAEEVAPHRRADRLHLLDADHQGDVVTAGLDLGRRRQHGDGARGAGGFVASGRQAAECRVDLDQEGAEVPLPGVELAGEVADVADLDLARLDPGGHQRRLDRLADHGADVFALLGPVAGEVGLAAAEEIDGCAHRLPP